MKNPKPAGHLRVAEREIVYSMETLIVQVGSKTPALNSEISAGIDRLKTQILAHPQIDRAMQCFFQNWLNDAGRLAIRGAYGFALFELGIVERKLRKILGDADFDRFIAMLRPTPAPKDDLSAAAIPATAA